MDAQAAAFVPDYESACQDIQEVLDELSVIRALPYFDRALGEKGLQALRADEARVRDKLRDTFTVVVAGDFKRGKSTLINAMLGGEVVPTGVLPETTTLNRISYGEAPLAEAVLKNGMRLKIDAQSVRRDALAPLMERLPSEIARLEIRDGAPLLQSISIIDTPGTGDLAAGEEVLDALSRADAVLYVVSVTAPLSQSEQALLSSIALPGRFARVFLVANMADRLESEEELRRMRQLLSERMRDMGDGMDVFLVSAWDEYCRKTRQPRPNRVLEGALEAGFWQMEEAIRTEMVLKKDILKSSLAIRHTSLMLANLSRRLSQVLESIKADKARHASDEGEFQARSDRLLALIECEKREICEAVGAMHIEAKEWMYSFLERMKEEIADARDADLSTGDLERYLQFYMMDALKQAVSACLAAHRAQLSVKLSKASGDLLAELRPASYDGGAAAILNGAIDVTWTRIDTAMFIGDALGAGGKLGIFYLVGRAVAGFARQAVLQGRKSSFLDGMLMNYEEISHEVVGQLQDVYDGMARETCLRIDRFYEAELSVASEAVQQASKLMQSEGERAGAAEAALGDILERVERCGRRMEKYGLGVPA
jgi:GTPase SAR1 family protein